MYQHEKFKAVHGPETGCDTDICKKHPMKIYELLRFCFLYVEVCWAVINNFVIVVLYFRALSVIGGLCCMQRAVCFTF
jgi:hypothetical protein